MSDKTPLTVIILTYNEELNIRQSILNVLEWAEEIYVLDSHSTDKTCVIAKELGAKVFYRQFDNYAKQRNYAIKELPTKTEWMMFLDADEYLTEALKEEIRDTLLQSYIPYDGYLLKRRFYFMGKWIKYGGYYPSILLRLFKRDKASCEREINEHIQVDGKVGYLKNDFVDDNQKGFSEWLNKHIKYADMEAQQFDVTNNVETNLWGTKVERTQWIRQKIWNKFLPPLIRPFMYFFYRYFFRFGFLDGKIGFIFHFMHALVYQLIIDIKYLEIKMNSKN